MATGSQNDPQSAEGRPVRAFDPRRHNHDDAAKVKNIFKTCAKIVLW
jgi:hypothetical protein